MTKQYKFLNNVIGWAMFAIAFIVYALTVEPTTSWWDCGEYISTAYKLEIGHPPGAPLFQMLGRFFSLFAFGNTAKVAYMINMMSVTASAFTILFLFWSITMLGKKLYGNAELSKAQSYTIFAAGIVGALAYTFSESFWFSAVEGEVYAMSSMFTALTFWAILKWEREANSPTAYRWLILIAYLIGLSIGIHLLNLLAIPAIAYVIYFKKYKNINFKGFALTAVISLLILSLILYIIMPMTLQLAGKFELWFVNSLGLPFNSGTIFFFVALVALVVWAWRFTLKKQQQIAHLSVVAITFILIGYSSYFVLAIRSNANPPINENEPKDTVAMLSYLLREQYGSRPLGYGKYYNANVVNFEDGNPIYIKDVKQGKYVITDTRKESQAVYNPELSTLFPRMWSNRDKSHMDTYKLYQSSKGRAINVTDSDGSKRVVYKPSFGDNLSFFFRFQLGHMYFRYFMWNFVGRQNDIESTHSPNIRNGNWISGIKFIDSWRLGNQDKITEATKNNPSHNTFYFLPLILGIIGLIFHFNKDMKDFWVVLLLFIMTGIAIIVYLNSPPCEPRERDYAYANSFYAFAIWIGLGVMSIAHWLRKVVSQNTATAISLGLCLLLVPGIMAQQGWDDHNRSGKTAARDFAINYLESCAPNAILFVNGDNDTFPLWYAQEVEGIRTDVRVVNFMLAAGPWYVHQMGRKIYNSEKIPLSIPQSKYVKGVNSYLPVFERVKGEYELADVIDFIISDDAMTQFRHPQSGSQLNYVPTKQLKISLDSARLVREGIVPASEASRIPKALRWQLTTSGLYKNELMLLDVIASNNWERPVYFANPSAVKSVLNLDKYMHLEGLVYRFLPYETHSLFKGMGGVNEDKTYDLLVNKAQWGNLANAKVTVDRESARNSNFAKNDYLRLAEACIKNQHNERAVTTLDTYFKHFPLDKFPPDVFTLAYKDKYYEAGALEKGKALATAIFNFYVQELDYINSLSPKYKPLQLQEYQTALAVLQDIAQSADKHKQTELFEKVSQRFETEIAQYYSNQGHN